MPMGDELKWLLKEGVGGFMSVTAESLHAECIAVCAHGPMTAKSFL